MTLVNSKIQRAFRLTKDLVEYLDESYLQFKMSDLPSNTIGEQLWCMVGARESYLKAIQNNGWVDFSCTLNNPSSKAAVLEAVERSCNAVLIYLENTALNEIQMDYLFELLEHEIQHHGQLIRFIYGNKLGFPQSWRDRYTV